MTTFFHQLISVLLLLLLCSAFVAIGYMWGRIKKCEGRCYDLEHKK